MKNDTTVGVTRFEVMTSQHLSPRPSVSSYLRSRHPSNIRSNSTRRAISSAHEGMSAEDASACADEIALRVELERMLEG